MVEGNFVLLHLNGYKQDKYFFQSLFLHVAICILFPNTVAHRKLSEFSACSRISMGWRL